MKSSGEHEELAVHLADMFAPLGSVSYARFFGGYGLKVEDVQFAMILEGTLYLRVDEALAEELKRFGAKPFTYETKVRSVTVGSYYSIPGELLDDPDQMAEWAKASLAAARQKAKKKPSKIRLKRRASVP
jgi:DNA transformation protein and related proteins